MAMPLVALQKGHLEGFTAHLYHVQSGGKLGFFGKGG